MNEGSDAVKDLVQASKAAWTDVCAYMSIVTIEFLQQLVSMLHSQELAM